MGVWSSGTMQQQVNLIKIQLIERNIKLIIISGVDEQKLDCMTIRVQ